MAYFSWIHNPEWVYCPLDCLHQTHCALTKLLDQELLLPNSDAMFTGAWR
jgi:hypothetical protein